MLPVLLLLLLLECHSFASNHQHAITRCGCAFRTTRTTHTRDCIGQLNRMCVRVRVCYGWENHKICKRALHTREREQRLCQIRVSMVWHIKNITFPPEWQLHPAVGEREMGERGRVKGKRNKKSIAWRGVQCAINKTEWRSNKNRSLTSQPKTHFCTHAFSTLPSRPPPLFTPRPTEQGLPSISCRGNLFSSPVHVWGCLFFGPAMCRWSIVERNRERERWWPIMKRTTIKQEAWARTPVDKRKTPRVEKWKAGFYVPQFQCRTESAII